MSERFRPRGARSTSCRSRSRSRAGSTRRREGLWRGPGYGRIETPVFEDTELFARGVGESTDIVQKQMFTFEDQGGRSLTLRPEGTASICRAYLEHGMHKQPQPVKLWYDGPVLPPRAPAGRPLPPVHPDRRRGDRLRLAARRRRDDRAGDDILAALGVAGVRLLLASLGTPATRERIPRRAARLPPLARGRSLARTSAAAIDATRCAPSTRIDEGTRKVMAEAPRLLDRLDPADAEHFAAGARAARSQRGRLRDRPDPGPRPRLLHADRLRVRVRRGSAPSRDRRRRPLRRPDRAARRAADARRAAGRWAWTGSLSPSERRRDADDGDATASSSSPRTTSATRPCAGHGAAPRRARGRTSTWRTGRSRAR